MDKTKKEFEQFCLRENSTMGDKILNSIDGKAFAQRIFEAGQRSRADEMKKCLETHPRLREEWANKVRQAERQRIIEIIHKHSFKDSMFNEKTHCHTSDILNEIGD